MTKALRRARQLLQVEHQVRLFDPTEVRVYIRDTVFPESVAVSVPIYIENAIPIVCNQKILLGIYRKQLVRKILTHECCHIRMWELNFPIIAIEWGGYTQQSPFDTVRLDGRRLVTDYSPLASSSVVTISTLLTEIQTYMFGYGRLGASYWRSLENFDFRMNERLMTQNPPQTDLKFQVMTNLALLYAAAVKFGNTNIRSEVESSKYPGSFSRLCDVLVQTQLSLDKDRWVNDFLMLLQAGKGLYAAL
jgi:hypothetical protein